MNKKISHVKAVKELELLLADLNACDEAVQFARGKTLQTAWDKCVRPDWMLWLLGKMESRPGWPDRKTIVLCACDCAETVLKYVPQGEDRPKYAIETARKFIQGLATKEELSAAASAASAASAVYAASSASAVYAVYAAASASAYAVYAASSASAYAVYAASSAYAYAAASRKNMTNIIRKRIPCPNKFQGGKND